MKISELSECSGVSIGTIKFYIREGLLPRGKMLAPNQADYGEEHLTRLKLIRALKEIGNLNTKAVREIVAAIELPPDESGNVFNLFLRQMRNTRPAPTLDPNKVAQTKQDLMGLLTERGWSVETDHPSLDDLAEAWVAFIEAWDPAFSVEVSDITMLDAYLATMEQLAKAELPTHVIPKDATVTANTFAQSIVGTVLFEPIITAIRRLAHSSQISKIIAENDENN